ncbi:MAG: hypothetical protein KJS64_05520 [Acidobacteria bacterium]|nr:hypothetical protein [Acidobacteriota bacterium]
MPRVAREVRDRRLNRSRHIAQFLVLGASGVAGTGVGMMAHAAAHPVSVPTTSTTIPQTSSTSLPSHLTTTTLAHSTTSRPHASTSVHTTTTVWTPPTTVHVPTTHCYTNASGTFQGCW